MNGKKSASDAGKRGSSLRKLDPSVRMPHASTLARLTEAEKAIVQRLISETAECVIHDRFRRRGAEDRFLRDAPDELNRPMGSGGALPPLDFILGVDETISLSQDEEQALFLRFNFCRYRILRTLQTHAGKRLTAKATRDLIKYARYAELTRNQIVQANLGLVPAMLKRSRITGFDFSDLIGEGYLALLRSVDKFDCSRGFKFSTYACRAILSSFSRAISRVKRDRSVFPTEFDPDLERSDQLDRKREDIEEECIDELRLILSENEADLNHMEERVIRERFGFDDPDEIAFSRKRKTLTQIADIVGVTRERVRQIQNKALGKLRDLIEEKVLVG
jgi:RNA polymerase primary sigma factor